jgi:hypothetical protein
MTCNKIPMDAVGGVGGAIGICPETTQLNKFN